MNFDGCCKRQRGFDEYDASRCFDLRHGEAGARVPQAAERMIMVGMIAG
jgi:hypothetical protein